MASWRRRNNERPCAGAATSRNGRTRWPSQVLLPRHKFFDLETQGVADLFRRIGNLSPAFPWNPVDFRFHELSFGC
jgi:hypothetical protein